MVELNLTIELFIFYIRLKRMKKELLNMKGSCLAPWQIEANENGEETYKMDYILSDDGILTISGNSHLCHIPAPDAIPYSDDPLGPPSEYSDYISQFKDMNFHTVVIEEGVRVLGYQCFKDCKSLKKIILPENMPVIKQCFDEGTSLEYTIKNNLKFLGPSSNPLYYLMGPTEDFDEETLFIPEGTKFIADYAFRNKKGLKQVVFSDTLEFLGWYTFEGTSIKELTLPEGKLAYDETLLAFTGETRSPLETISLPYSMYKIYKEGKDRGLVEAWSRSCRIIYRNPDDSVAEIIECNSPDNIFT